jgi:hypothetical protein
MILKIFAGKQYCQGEIRNFGNTENSEEFFLKYENGKKLIEKSEAIMPGLKSGCYKQIGYR